MAAAALQLPAFVTFSVAGTRFVTSRDTLLKEPTSRLALLARGVLPAPRDDSGAIFLDRDAKHFQLILNYLRDGWCSLPAVAAERRELLQEVRFYQLASMEAWVRSQELALSSGEAASAAAAAALGPALQLPRPSSALGPDAAYSSRASALCAFAATGPSIMPSGHPSSSSAAAMPPAAYSIGAYGSICSSIASGLGGGVSPFRTSLLAGSNQDLLGAGALAACGISGTTLGRLSLAPSLPAATAAAPVGVSKFGAFAASAAEPTAPAGYLSAAAPRASYMAGEGLAAAAAGLSRSLPALLPVDGYKWTTSLLKSNPKMQEVVNTLVELASLPPHASLHAGKVAITITSECQHGGGATAAGSRASGLLLLAQHQLDAAHCRNQLIRVSSSMGWVFELALRPTADVALQDKYGLLPEFLQDNWFVLAAVLKEQYGVIVEEDTSSRPSCLACRRHNITLTLQRFF